MTVLEENGGGDGNSSVAELEVRVETLEETAADHETRISATEAEVMGKFIVTMSDIKNIRKKGKKTQFVLQTHEY